VIGEHASNALGRKHVGKRQTVTCQKGVDNPLKSAIAASPSGPSIADRAAVVLGNRNGNAATSSSGIPVDIVA